MAAVGAASEREPLTAAVLDARASIGAQLDDGVEAKVDASAALSVPATLPTIPSRPPPQERPPPPQNETNATDPAPPPQPTNQTQQTAADPATLAPHEQQIRGQAGAPIRFVVLLTNTAGVAQNVTLMAKPPVSWEVTLSPESAFLGPDETVAITGTIMTPRLVGTAGSVMIRALGPGGEDIAYVDLCTVGDLQEGCKEGRPYTSHGNSTASNQTRANGTQPAPAREPEPSPSREPAQNGTTTPAPQPAPQPAPASNSTKRPPSNATEPAPSNGGSGGSNDSGSASAEAWITIEADFAGADDDEHEATNDEGTEDEDESPPPVTVDV